MEYTKKRFLFFLSLTILTYGVFVGTLFWGKRILLAVGLFCILFILLNFLAIDLRKVEKKKIWIPLIGSGFIIRLFMPNPVWQLALSLWISLFAIWFLIFFLRNYFSEVRKIHWFSYFTSWGYLFSLITAILFGFIVLGMNSRFPFTCEQISWRNQKIIQTSTNPFHVSFQNNEKDKEVFLKEEEISPLQSVLWILRTNVLWWFVETQKSINTKVCEAIIWQLEQVYQNPVFQIGAIFGMYLLFYGVIRLLVWIITLIGFVVFLGAKRFWWYPTTTKMEEVEELL